LAYWDYNIPYDYIPLIMWIYLLAYDSSLLIPLDYIPLIKISKNGFSSTLELLGGLDLTSWI
jgi:hypothetical protein